jgi:hypothetical protein
LRENGGRNGRLFVGLQREERLLHIGKESRRGLVKEKVGIVVDIPFCIVLLVVSSGKRDDDGFDVEEFLFGEGSRSSAGEADVRKLIQLPHLLLGQKIERMDIFLWEKWFEIVVEFA